MIDQYHGRRNRGAQGARAPPIILPSKTFNGRNALKLRKFEIKKYIFNKFPARFARR